MFLHSLRIHQRNSPAAMSGVYRYTVSPPLPAPPLQPPLTPAATPRPREAGHLLVAPARPLRYVSPPPPPRFHPAHATQALPWSSPCLRSAAPLATRLQSPSPPPFPVSTPFCFRAPCRAGNPIIYRLTVRPKQCPTDLDDQSRGTRTNKKAWITCMVVYS